MRYLAWGTCGVTAALAAGRLGLALVDPQSATPDEPLGWRVPLAAFDAVIMLLLSALGAVVALRRPGNAIGWILCTIPVSLGMLLVSSHVYESLAADQPDGLATALVAWLAGWIWIPFAVPALALFPLLFPTGRPLSRRWRKVGWMAAAACPALFVGIAFAPGRLEDRPVENPLGVGGTPGNVVEMIGGLGFGLMIVAILSSVVSLFIRFRRSHGEERQQLKWVTAAAGLFVVTFAFPTDEVAGEAGFGVLLLGLVLVEATVAIAMLRYRLYDIDVVINRALVYGPLTATLAGVYIGTVLLLQSALSGFTEGSSLAVAASTLAVAALFSPVRSRIQAAVDRRFFRRRYDAARTLEAFGARLRDEIDLDSLDGELRAVVTGAMQPAHVSLWLRRPEATP